MYVLLTDFRQAYDIKIEINYIRQWKTSIIKRLKPKSGKFTVDFDTALKFLQGPYEQH